MDTPHTALELIKKLSQVGIALSAEKDNARLMELILQSAKEVTNADGGTLYIRTEDDKLIFEIMLTDSLGIHMGGTSGEPITLPPVRLFDDDNRPNYKTVAARAAVSGDTVNVLNAYDSDEFDFSGTHDFDRRTGYRSTSFLTVPMRNHDDEVTGVLQLINAKNAERETISFTEADQLVVESLASQAAIALTKKRLLDEQRVLFESFIELIATAIDDKSPYTGGHCRRVPELTMMLANAAAKVDYGPLKDFTMNEDDRYELRIAGWLHDCGKVTTPEYVVDKATKLETIYDRVHLVDTRFVVLKRDAEIAALKAQLGATEKEREEINRSLQETLDYLEGERAFIAKCNIGTETMDEADKSRIRSMARHRYVNQNGEDCPLLTEEEIRNLTVSRGTLTSEEREIINYHIVATIKMLEQLPYPKHLRRVPEFAGGHHERMDGKGYPKGLVREEMSVQARIMGIADIFEALTAGDRPYKKAMPISQALTILGKMKVDNHVDPDLFDVFMREQVYLDYAEKFLDRAQLDEFVLSEIPGFQATLDN